MTHMTTPTDKDLHDHAHKEPYDHTHKDSRDVPSIVAYPKLHVTFNGLVLRVFLSTCVMFMFIILLIHSMEEVLWEGHVTSMHVASM